MSRYSITLGSTTFTPFAGFAHAYSSNYTPSTANSNSNGAISPASGTTTPLMVSSLTLYFQSVSGGAGNFACGANETMTSRQALSSSIGDMDDTIGRVISYPAYASETLYYGFIKSDTTQTNFYSGTVSGSNIYSNGSVIFSGRAMYATLQFDTVPSAVSSLSATPTGSSSISVSWSSPSDDGGPGIGGYRIAWRVGSGSWSFNNSASTSYSITGLSASTTYEIRVGATNAVTDLHNSSFGYSGTQYITGTSSTTSATTNTDFLAPSFTDGVANRTYRVGDSVFEYVAADNTYSGYGQGGTNFTLSTSIPGLFISDYGTFAYIEGTVGGIATGSYGVSVTAYGPGGTASSSGTWSISQALPSWTDDTLASGRVGAAYSSTISANNTSYWSITNLPPGLSATDTSGTTATITGTPTAAGSYTISATPYNTDNASGGTRNISLNVAPRIPQWVDTTISTSARVGVSYSDTISANFVSYWTDGTLPLNGISFSGQTNVSGLATGTISGTPTNFGTINFTITPYNSDDETPGGEVLSIAILDGSLSWADQALAITTVTEGQSYSDGVSVSAGPVSVAYTVTSGYSLPSGLSLNSSSGAITGTPDVPGSYTFRVTATNGSSETITTADLALIVEAAGGFVRVWNGTAWVDAVAYVRTASNTWAEGTVQVRSGGSWTTSFTA
jgi:hypothetical protein